MFTNEVNCTPPAIDNYPNGLLSSQQLLEGGFLGPFTLAIFCISGITILCDEYFVPCLEYVRTEYKIRAHIAGATIMAIGSSSPEFFTNVMGTFVARDKIGIGTILGSALFNIFVILATIGLVCYQSKRVIQLQFYPITRDIFFYGLSILTLVLILRDGFISWIECLLLIALYGLYMISLICDVKIAQYFSVYLERDLSFEEEKLLERSIDDKWDSEDEEEMERYIYPWSGICSNRRGFFSTLQRIKFLPLRILFFLTIPDMNRVPTRWKKIIYPFTFIMSLLYMSILTYLLTWMTTTLTYISGIPDSVAGLTFIAAGTSIPELVASVLVIRDSTTDGGGTMAVSNLIGSNTFDILICLGVPWLLSCLVKGGSGIEMMSEGLEYSITTLIVSLLLLYVMLYRSGFYVTKMVAWTSLIIYAVIILISILLEMNVFYDFNLSTCESKYLIK